MRVQILVLTLSAAVAAAGCMKKQADGTYRPVNPMASTADRQKARDNAAKSGDELKTDLQKAAEKVKAGAEKARDSEALKRAEEKAGEGLEKAGEKLRRAGEKTKEKARE